jgi:hypothetical protein
MSRTTEAEEAAEAEAEAEEAAAGKAAAGAVRSNQGSPATSKLSRSDCLPRRTRRLRGRTPSRT